jgi:hypothetical protein
MKFAAGWKPWRKILFAACCIIIVTGIAIIFFIPLPGGYSGTCGPDDLSMTSISTIPPAFATSFLQEFGQSEPGPGPDLPPMVQYPLRRQIIDSLMARAPVTVPENSILGLYEFPDSRLLLLVTDTGLVEILETGDRIRMYHLEPEPVGARRTGYDQPGPPLRGTYNFSTMNNVTIQRVRLVLPDPGNKTAPMYIVKKTRTETFLETDGTEAFSISTTGTFYVLYGMRVERVVASHALSFDPSWKLCRQETRIAGEGGNTGELIHTAMLARSSERMQQSHQITTGAFIQIFEGSGGSTSWWRSRDNTGCGC